VRDALTFLAGLVLLALLAALVGPGFVDWSQHRALVEDRLKAIAGVDIVTTGPIELRLLPSPRIAISGLRIGDADPQGTRATATAMRAEMDLAPLLKGEVKLSSVSFDGVDVTLALRGGALAAPPLPPGAAIPSIAQLTVTRGQITAIDEQGSIRAALPFAFEASLPGGPGPSRIEGEIAGRSFRLTTGDRDAAGRVRVKLASAAAASRAEFDGWAELLRLPGDRLALRPEGQASFVLSKPGEPQPLLTIAGKLQAEAAGWTLSALSVDGGPLGRVEGEANWSLDWKQPARIALQTRRIDLAGLFAPGPLGDAAAGLGWLEPFVPDLDLRLAADQLSYRGEEATEGRLQLQRRAKAWRLAGGQAKFSGATARVEPSGDAGLRAILDAPDLRRIALAMQRLDLPQGLAEDIAALGQIAGSVELQPRPGALEGAPGEWRIAAWELQGRFGQARGAGDLSARRLLLNGTLTGADLLFLVRPVAALAALVPRDLDVEMAGNALRIGDGASGSGRIAALRENGRWRMTELEGRGFGGLTASLRRSPQAPGFALALSAPQADAIGALAERLVEQRQLAQGLRAIKGLSPLRLEGRVVEKGQVWAVDAAGQAGSLALEVSGEVDAAGRWRGVELALSSTQRGALFRALGLPEPADAGVATKLSARLGEAGPAFVLSGADGLSAEALGPWGPDGTLPGTGLSLIVSAPRPSALLPGFAAAGAEPLNGRARLGFNEGSVRLEGIEAEMGGAVRGSFSVAASGAVSGALVLPSLDLGALAGWITGGAAATGPEGAWSGARFAEARKLPDLSLTVSSERFLVPMAGALSGQVKIESREQRLGLSEIRLDGAGLSIAGSMETERAGSQLSVRLSGEAQGVELARLFGPDFSGVGALSLQLGAAGESPARLAASLTGAGQFKGRNLALSRLDPNALDRIAGQLASDVLVADAAQLAAAVRQAVEGGGWRLGDLALPFVISAGVARLSPFVDERPNAGLSAAGALDLRSGAAELRAALQGKTIPRGWTGPLPQIAVTWRGPWRAAARSYDVSVLSNAVSQRALQREIERVEALEADIRERAAFNRRLRAERERREEEARATAAEARRREERAREERLREERERAERAPAPQPAPIFSPAAAPPLPPPVEINPVPAPLSRPVGRLE
jgi:hypothetical protein